MELLAKTFKKDLLKLMIDLDESNPREVFQSQLLDLSGKISLINKQLKGI